MPRRPLTVPSMDRHSRRGESGRWVGGANVTAAEPDEWPLLPGGVDRVRGPVTVVIPVLNGLSYLPAARARVVRAMSHVADDFHLIFVDDGSTDGTWQEICRMASESGLVSGVRLERNMGQASAIAAGLSMADGPIVATIDVDLEAFPEDLPLLCQEVSRGADLASGRRMGARGWVRGTATRVFNARVRRSGVGLHDLGCGMNAMSADVASRYVAHGDIRRALPKSLLVMLARHVVEVPVRSSKSRTSSLGFKDLVNYWVEFESMHGRRASGRAARRVAAMAWTVPLLVAGRPACGRGPHARTRGRHLTLALLFASVLTGRAAGLTMIQERRAMPPRPGFRIVETTVGPQADAVTPISS